MPTPRVQPPSVSPWSPLLKRRARSHSEAGSERRAGATALPRHALRPKSWQPSSEPSSPKSMTPQCGTSSMRSRISCVQTSRPCRTCSMRPKRISAPSPRSLVSTGRKPKSNNPLERVNAEIKRRTRVVGIFPNDASVLRLITAVCIEQHDEWTASERRYLSEGSMALLTVKDTAAALIGKQQALVARSRKR